MGGAEDAFKMDNSQVWLSVFMEFGFHHPVASFFFWFIANYREPLNKGTWVTSSLMHKSKEQENASDFQPTHSW